MQVKLITIKRAASIMDCSEKTVRRLVCSGDLIGCKIRGALRIDLGSLTSYIHRHIEHFCEQNGTFDFSRTEVDRDAPADFGDKHHMIVYDHSADDRRHKKGTNHD